MLAVAPAGPGEPAYRLALPQLEVEAPPDQRGLYEAGPAATRRTRSWAVRRSAWWPTRCWSRCRDNGYKGTDLSGGRREPFTLAEESGVRLGLLFLAVRPITKVDRIEVISQGIRALTSEEAYYWYSKCTSGPAAERALRALRVLLADL